MRERPVLPALLAFLVPSHLFDTSTHRSYYARKPYRKGILHAEKSLLDWIFHGNPSEALVLHAVLWRPWVNLERRQRPAAQDR